MTVMVSYKATMIFVLMVLLIAFLPAKTSHAQSFDCQKAADVVDKMICSTPELSALDNQLGTAWRNFRAQRPDLVQQAKNEGLAWLRQRKSCSDSANIVGCIRELESSRIQNLNSFFKEENRLTSSQTKTDYPEIKNLHAFNPDARSSNIIKLISSQVYFLKAIAAQNGTNYVQDRESFWDFSSLVKSGMAVDAPNFWQEYEANEVSADDKYKGKLVIIQGRILSIQKDFTGSAYVELEVSSASLTSIHAGLTGNMMSEAAKFEKGQNVRLICTGSGQIMGSPVLSNCQNTLKPDPETVNNIGSQIDRWMAGSGLPAL